MANAWRIADEQDVPSEPRTQKRPTRSGTIRIDEGELLAAAEEMQRLLHRPMNDDGEDEDTITSSFAVPLHEPVRDARSGLPISGEEPLCAAVTPGSVSCDMMPG